MKHSQWPKIAIDQDALGTASWPKADEHGGKKKEILGHVQNRDESKEAKNEMAAVRKTKRQHSWETRIDSAEAERRSFR